MHVYVDTLNRISPTIDWADPDPEDREEILKILRKRIQSIRCAAQPRMAYQQVLFASTPRTGRQSDIIK